MRMEAQDWIAAGILCGLRFFGALLAFRLLRGAVNFSIIAVLALNLGFFAASFAVDYSVRFSGFGLLQLGFSGVCSAAAGFLIASPCAIALEAVVHGGRLVDTARGAQFAEQIVPGSEDAASLLEQMAMLLCCQAVFVWRGYQPFLQVMLRSLADFPPASVMIGERGQGTAAVFGEQLIWFSEQVLRASMFLAVPVIVCSLIIDLAGGVLSRICPRANAAFEFLPIKMVLGLVLLALVLADFPRSLQQLLRTGCSLVQIKGTH